MNQAQSGFHDLSAHPGLPAAESVFLVLLLAIELWIFTGSFHKFFTHDSLFYMTNIPKTWGQLWQDLVAPSQEKNFRPLNLVFIALCRPFLGTDPRLYHWIPILFQLANTVLFFLLAKRILLNSVAVLAATAFWGLHSVAGWITYDITYLSDFMLAFLLLLLLLLVVEGNRRKSRVLISASLIVFLLSLLTKESATTFPLAVWISLGLADLKVAGEPVTWQRIRISFRKSLLLTCLFLIIAIAFGCLFIYWLHTGLIYTGSGAEAYGINPWANPFAKTRYLFWALNLPDTLSIPNPGRNRALAYGLMASLLLIWALDILRRRARLSVIEWAGVAWFAGLNAPVWLLSSRLAKWYLYIPLLGLALTFGTLAESLQALASTKLRRIGVLVIPGLLAVPILFSSMVQTRSYVARSDSSYQSDVLQSCLSDFQAAHPTLPSRITLFFLPAFEEGISDLLSIPPIDRGQLFELYYPGTSVQTIFAHRGGRLPADASNRSDIIVLQYLNGCLLDVTTYFKATGKMTLFLLPTSEGVVAPLLKKEPAGGRKLHQEYVQMLFADEGARLPEDYYDRRGLWVLQYLNGRFSDVTEYYRGRHRNGALRVIRGLEDLQFSVNRAEYYPDYEHFGTPTGAPVFFPTPQREILTQIGGSTVIVPLHKIPAASSLRFDVSWMFELGDGAWAEAAIRSQATDSTIFRQYMQPDSRRKNLVWKEISIDLQRFENQEVDLILKCYNDPGKHTAADWLNWRDITIEMKSQIRADPAR